MGPWTPSSLVYTNNPSSIVQAYLWHETTRTMGLAYQYGLEKKKPLKYILNAVVFGRTDPRNICKGVETQYKSPISTVKLNNLVKY